MLVALRCLFGGVPRFLAGHLQRCHNPAILRGRLYKVCNAANDGLNPVGEHIRREHIPKGAAGLFGFIPSIVQRPVQLVRCVGSVLHSTPALL